MNIKNKENIFSYLKNGCYIFNEDFTQLVLIDNLSEIPHFNSKGILKRIKHIFKFIKNKRKIEVFTNVKKFNGDLLLIPSTQYGYKVFGDKNIITIFNDNDFFYKIIENRKKISEIFDVPNTTIDEKEKSITEERIKLLHSSNKDDNENRIIYFMKNYTKYFSQNKQDISTIYFDDKKYRFKIFYRAFFKKIRTKNNINAIIQHGDMWTNNILFDGVKYYVIDYENVDKKYVLYDFFTYIYNEMLINNNSQELLNYFNGVYDNILNEYMSSIGLEYDSAEKKEYFCAFLKEILNEKFPNYNLYYYFIEINKMKKIIKFLDKEGKL